MKRFCVLGAILLTFAPLLVAEDPLRIIDLRVATLKLDAQTGDLRELAWKQPHVDVIRETKLGENFRLLLPHPDYEANYFLSGEQRVSRIEAAADGVTCVYDSLRNERGRVDVGVGYTIRAVDERLEFSIEVRNPTALPLAEVYFGIIGGQQGLGNRLDTESLVPGLNANLAPAIFQRFGGGSYGGGNLGIPYSAAGFNYPGSMTMSWIEFCNRKTGTGLYYADHDPASRLSTLYFEVRPFTRTAVTGDTWPAAADLPPGEPVGLTMGWVKYPYTRQGTFQSGPIALQVHPGGWQEGSRLYRRWFDRHFPVARPANWLRREMAWQSIIMLGPEDRVRHRFADLPKLARDAKKYGVTTFEILGWDTGGIDRGYPEYTPDPRLGSRDDFRRALAEIRSIGVNPLIFANVQFADTATALFRNQLSRYAVRGPYANDWGMWGWGENTIGARMGLRRHNMTLISPSHEAVRKLLNGHFLQLLRDGARGFQLDKTTILAALDFNPAVPTSPDRSLPEGLLTEFRELLAQGRAVDPDFALASEIWWDRSFQFVDVAYVRMNNIDMNSPALRYTFPEWTSTIFAESPGDINVMNNGMRYGLVWALAPRHYGDSMDEKLTQPLSAYVRELIRIRSRHRDVLFHGRFRDTEGATVQAGSNVRYAVFEGAGRPGKACVVVNYGETEATAEVNWPGGEGKPVEVVEPFQPDAVRTLPVKLLVPARRCVVVAAK